MAVCVAVIGKDVSTYFKVRMRVECRGITTD